MQWFKHESNANSDDKLQNVLLDYGLEGYGLYWYCLELIVNRVDKDNITFELKHDARIIAKNTGCSVQKVEEMMKRFIELGLFEASEGNITCLKLLKRMDSSMTSNQFMRDLISKANKRHDVVMTTSAKPMQEEKRIDKNRNTTGSRLTHDFQLSNEWIIEAKKIKPSFSDSHINFVFDGFKDYWIGIAGAKGVKLDWIATWRNWIRRQDDVKQSANNELSWIKV